MTEQETEAAFGGAYHHIERTEPRTLGQVLFEVHCRECLGRSYGFSTALWSDQLPEVRGAWTVASSRVYQVTKLLESCHMGGTERPLFEKALADLVGGPPLQYAPDRQIRARAALNGFRDCYPRGVPENFREHPGLFQTSHCWQEAAAAMVPALRADHEIWYCSYCRLQWIVPAPQSAGIERCPKCEGLNGRHVWTWSFCKSTDLVYRHKSTLHLPGKEPVCMFCNISKTKEDP